MRSHTVKQGECLTSLEEKYEIPWKKIWNEGTNSQLKSRRKDPNILNPGDRIYIPDRIPRRGKSINNLKHLFRLSPRRPTLNMIIRIRAVDGNEVALANESFEIHFDGGSSKTGKTSRSGRIKRTLPKYVNPS
jgi:N-acetylmuramoyl-L-alanine amidase|tara:strand:+ start:636 stop:1034 length:399 start_codon:yes stop_codon:yes gene_type:complete